MNQQKKDKKSVIAKDISLPIADDMLLSMIPKDKLLQLANRLNSYLEQQPDISKEELYGKSDNLIPLSIFSQKLSPLEALSKFLKEERDMSYHNIGVKIGRDERGIWVTYRNAKKKMESKFKMQKDDLFIPLAIFTKDLSILESLVSYLREEKEMRGSKIASLINKSTSTIWTVYNRAKQKNER